MDSPLNFPGARLDALRFKDIRDLSIKRYPFITIAQMQNYH